LNRRAGVTAALRLAVVRDYRAEGWLSMDLCADQLLMHLPKELLQVTEVAPPFRRLLSRWPCTSRTGFNADRFVNRYLLLPRHVCRVASRVDFVHIVDHSYAHLVHAVPGGRAGVYCHDLNAFRCLLQPDREPRPRWFCRLVQHVLDGFRQAAVVFYNSRHTGEELLRYGLVPQERLVHAPLGVAPEFTPQPPATPVPLPLSTDPPYLLHVGSNSPRKRLDLLLDIFAAVRLHLPALRLVQVGGPWPAACLAQIRRLGLGSHITQVRGLSREQLAELYRRAAAVLVTSDAEGFGLPVIEALACGAVVVASDLPAVREAGGSAAVYCPVGNIPVWTATLVRLLQQPDWAPPRTQRLAHAGRFSWAEHARIIASTYSRLVEPSPGGNP
jgi:glycosyltransferase involved in cell wall biosynthesis